MGLQARHGILLLFIFLVLAGCSSPVSPPSPGGDASGKTPTGTAAGPGPIQDITSRNPPRVSLDDALVSLSAAEREGILSTQGTTLIHVFGYGVDMAGNARTWVLGMQRGGSTMLLEYSEGEWKELDLPITFAGGEVNLKEIKSPGDLYRQNMKTIVGEMNRHDTGESDLDLDEDTYLVTIQSPSGSSTLSFKARSGELIQSA